MLSQAIDWAADPQCPPIEDVQVDHRGSDVAMPEQFLHGANVVPVFEQRRRKAVTKNVRTNTFGDPRPAHGLHNLLLDHRLVQWTYASSVRGL